MSNLMAIINLNGEIEKTDAICVHGELERGIPESCNEAIKCVKYIDNKISKRYDEKVSEVLQYFNKIFTANLKNYIDKGNISKEKLIEKMKSIGIENIYYSAFNKRHPRKPHLPYSLHTFNDTNSNAMQKQKVETSETVDMKPNDTSRITKKDN